MTISTELNQIGSWQQIAPTISNLSMRALSQLAYSLKDTESESEKTALLEKIDLETDLKGEVLSESEIKKIREEIESQYRSQQTDLFDKLECFASENKQLKSELDSFKKFKQLYEETYQEKRHLEQQKQNLDSELEQIKGQIVKEKENAVKDYVSKHSQDLESKKQKLERDSSRLQAEITASETNLLSIKSQLDYAKNL